jgi:uncharacterized protein (DUF1499 family)
VRRLLGLVVLAVVVFVGMLAAGMVKNRLPWSQPPGFTARVRTYLDTHVAETVEGSPFPELRPRHYEVAPDELFATVERAIAKLGSWEVTERRPAERTLRVVVTSTIWRFRDDAVVRVEAEPAGPGAVLLIRSASRVGKGDLGANTRHVLNLYAELDGMIPPPRTAAYKTPPARTTPLF